MARLQDAVALITGGARGQGAEEGKLFVAEGATVVLADVLDEQGEQTAGEIGAEYAHLDVAPEEQWDSVVTDIVARHGRLDILVNNAAGNFYAPSSTLSPNAWRAVVETDLYGSFYCAQAAYPAMKAVGGGRIISISMTLHYRGWPLMAHATAAKAGVDALTRTLALEWAPDRITVNAVAPGPIPTEGVQRAFTPPDGRAPDLFRMDRYVEEVIPLGRWGTPEDVGRMVAFLAGPAGEWITGAILVVDGGSWLAGGRT